MLLQTDEVKLLLYSIIPGGGVWYNNQLFQR